MNDNQKKYRKYVALLSDVYEKVLKNSISNKNLILEEKYMISILNNKLEPHQRLAKYQQLLFKKLFARAHAHNGGVKSSIALRHSNHRVTGIGDRIAGIRDRLVIKSMQTGQLQKTYEEDEFDKHFSSRRGVSNFDEIFANTARRFSTPHEDFHDARPDTDDKDDIYAKDHLEFDASAEKKRVLEEIRRLSTSVPDWTKLQFCNLGKADEK